MSTISTVLDFVGASGFVAAAYSVFGLGRLHQQVEQHAARLDELQDTVASGTQFAGENKVTLARLEERVRSIKEDLAEIKSELRKASNV
jgi:chromosome segregation ATPase